MTAKSDEFKLEELKRLLRRLDQTMQASPPTVKDVQGIAPLIPTGREVLVAAPPADALAGVRGQGRASTSGRTIVLAAGVSATVSLSVFALVFGGIATPQRQITAKDEAEPTARVASEPRLLPARGEQTRQAAVAALQASPPEPAQATEATPRVEARADIAALVPNPTIPERVTEAAPVLEPPQETAALKGADNVPASKDTDGPSLGELDALQLLRRGLNMLSSGNVGAAQLLLERAADLGSGDAAFALATTYDGAPGSPRSGSAVRPNVDLALRWYARAQELGVESARKRLSELKN